MARRWPVWNLLLPALAWLTLLAVLPWWFGLPLLLALAAIVLVLQQRLADEHAALIRRALRWGLAGLLFTLQRSLGGDAFAWGAALLGALAGYTLLAGLEAWLDRDLRRSPVAVPTAEWPELANAPIGPPAEIIELQPPVWQRSGDAWTDPCGGGVDHRGGSYLFADGSVIADAGPPAAFSPAGRWFAARSSTGRGVVLWDRERDRSHRLRGWQLCGWYREQPWLIRREGDMPQPLSAVSGQQEEEASP
jgi:hypothetical protein